MVAFSGGLADPGVTVVDSVVVAVSFVVVVVVVVALVLAAVDGVPVGSCSVDASGIGTPSSTSLASYFSILSGLAFRRAILSFWRMFSSSSSSALVSAALDSPSDSWTESEHGYDSSGWGGSTSTMKDRSPLDELVIENRDECSSRG